jgi:RNA polymerase sigma factor (sigma-70 family)
MCAVSKKKIELTNDIIIYGLKNNDRKILNQVYSKYYPIIQRYITIRGGTDDDAKDVFQDAIVVLYQKAVNNTLVLNGKFITLLYGVCKILWFRTLRYREKHQTIPIDSTIIFPYIDDILAKMEQDRIDEIKKMLFDKYFKKLTNRDQDIMRASIGISTAALADKFGLTVASAKTRRYMCREKIKLGIKKDKKYIQLQRDLNDN